MTWLVDIYFVSCIVICSFFLLKLTVAVMLGKYKELDKNEHDSRHKNDLREIGNELKLPPELTEFFIDQENIEIRKRTKAIKKHSCRRRLQLLYKQFIYQEIKVPENNNY